MKKLICFLLLLSGKIANFAHSYNYLFCDVKVTIRADISEEMSALTLYDHQSFTGQQ